ncbi:MAG: class I SAM-dependent methyltransferase, partial [Blastococcus sp.]
MLAGAVPSPNIWHHTATYELENRAADPDGWLWSAMADAVSWAGRDVLDLGCGTGFHLPRFAETARSVVGVEPHPDLVALARRRTRRLAHVSVVQGVAQSIPLPDASVDVLHVRWAYFFGPGSEPGLAEVDRVMRRGGTALIIDNDATRSTFGGWFR